MLLREVLHSLRCLYIFQLSFIDILQFVHFVNAQDNWDRGASWGHDLIYFLFPVGCVFNTLDVGDVSHHDDAICLSAEVSIQAIVACVHAYQIPDMQSDLVPSDIHDFSLELRAYSRCVIRLKSVANKSIHNGSFAHRWIAKQNDFEHFCIVLLIVITGWISDFKSIRVIYYN